MLVRRRLVGLVRETPVPVLCTVLLALGGTACAVGQGFAIAEALRRAFTGRPLDELLVPVAAVAALVATRTALLWARDMTATWTAHAIKERLRDRLVDRLLKLGPGHTLTHPAGRTQATVGDGVEAIQAYVGFYLPQVAVSLAGPLAIVATLTWLDPVVGVTVGACVLLVPLSRPLWRRLLGDRASAHWDAYERFAARILDALTGMTTLKTLGAGERYGVRLRTDAERLYRATMGNLAASTGVYCVTAFVMTAGTALSVAVAALRLAGGHLDAAALFTVLFLAAECFRPLQELQNYWHEGFYGLAAAGGIFSLLDAEPQVRAPERAIPLDPAGPPEVRFENVTFAYPGSRVPALDRVDLRIAPGATLAVVGRSGAGKSTLVSLLLRFFDPQEGRILIDGVDLRRAAPDDVRAMTAVVSQDVHLFYGTVADNLRIAAPEATRERLEDAARRARVHEVIAALPDGYETVIGERGATLSGGERQRLAIARALLKNAPILVLDEATSSVDGQTEKALQEALAEITAERTTLVIAHRLSTVLTADHVAVLDGGRVVEHGPPAELFATGGAWAELVAVQAGAAR
ncbi:ABC transporter ATP-binding protein [Streptosporangium fragile]|uniref:ABC transporter ATP-binding protein n=1 Tax=Streptosporangium fragile TaxID=46186 RepID=A0ABP6INS3_9ACTN